MVIFSFSSSSNRSTSFICDSLLIKFKISGIFFDLSSFLEICVSAFFAFSVLNFSKFSFVILFNSTTAASASAFVFSANAAASAVFASSAASSAASAAASAAFFASSAFFAFSSNILCVSFASFDKKIAMAFNIFVTFFFCFFCLIHSSITSYNLTLLYRALFISSLNVILALFGSKNWNWFSFFLTISYSPSVSDCLSSSTFVINALVVSPASVNFFSCKFSAIITLMYILTYY